MRIKLPSNIPFFSEIKRKLAGEPKLVSPVPIIKPPPIASPTPTPKLRSRYLGKSPGFVDERTQGKQISSPSFGIGQEPVYIEPKLYDSLLALKASNEERMNLAELSGQESSYGYAKPHISETEESYGPVHINLKAGRINPNTGKAFAREEAEDINTAIQYALDEYRRTGGLGMWNPIQGKPNPFYQYEIPKRAKTKKYIRANR